MISHVFAVFDSAAQVFGRPFTAPTVAVARRGFADEVNRAGSELNSHAADFHLSLVGRFEDGSGRLEAVGPEVVCRALDVKEV